jgi:hypothetical protein
MKLTTQLLARFIGGQIEVQNPEEGYLFRGEIKTAEVTLIGEMEITLNWMAKAEGIEGGGPPVPRGWINETNLDYGASLEIYSVSDIGPSAEGGDSRICLRSDITGEIVVLYPPNGSKLDPARVEGLHVAQ